jgi:hypothetical protein
MADEFPVFLGAALIVLALLLVITNFEFIGVPGTVEPVPIFEDGFEDVRFVGPFGSIATFSQNADFSVSAESDYSEIEDTYMFNGVFFGANEIKYSIEQDVEEIEINFRVIKMNGYGELIIKLNDKTIEQKEYELGDHTITINGGVAAGSVVEIRAVSSGWRIWAPTVFDLNKITIKTRAKGNNEFHFSLNGELNTFENGKIDLSLKDNVGSLDIYLNGNLVSRGFLNDIHSIPIPKENLVTGDNTITFETETGLFEGQADVVIFYEVTENKYVDLPFTIQKNVYDDMRSGYITFDVVDITHGGGMAVKINVGSETLFRQFENVEQGHYTLVFGKQDARPGINRIVVESIDGASFGVRNIEVSV